MGIEADEHEVTLVGGPCDGLKILAHRGIGRINIPIPKTIWSIQELMDAPPHRFYSYAVYYEATLDPTRYEFSEQVDLN